MQNREEKLLAWLLHIVKLKVIHLWAYVNYLAITLEKWCKLAHGSFWICLNLETEKYPVTSYWVWPHWRHGPVALCVLVRQYMPRIEYNFCTEDSWEITARSLSKYKMCAILWFLKEGSRAPDCFWLTMWWFKMQGSVYLLDHFRPRIQHHLFQWALSLFQMLVPGNPFLQVLIMCSVFLSLRSRPRKSSNNANAFCTRTLWENIHACYLLIFKCVLMRLQLAIQEILISVCSLCS